MSADIWLQDAAGNTLPLVEGDLDAEFRRMVPMRSSGTSWHSESINVTHNLGGMLRAAGMVDAWDTVIGKKASLAGAIVAATLSVLESNPEAFRRLEPRNGWGTYEGLLPVLKVFVEGCKRWPDAIVGGSV